MAEQIGLQAILDLSDFNKGVNAYMSGLGKMDKQSDSFISRASKAWMGFGTSLVNVGEKMSNVGNTLSNSLTRPLLGFAATAVDVAAEFGGQMALIDVATQGTGLNLESVREFALKMGADSVFGATEAAEAMLGLLKAGQKSEEVMGTVSESAGGMAAAMALAKEKGITLSAAITELGGTTGTLDAVLNLATAGELSMADASDFLSVAMATFGLDASQATEIVDGFVMSADASVMSVQDIADALKNVGPTAAAFGFSLEDTNNALAILSQRGIAGGEAGTALKSMFTNMLRQTPKVKDALGDLNIALYDTEGNMKDLPTIVDEFSKSLGENAEMTTYVGALSLEEEKNLTRLQKAYVKTGRDIQDYTDGIKGAGMSEAERTEKLNELRAQLGNIDQAMSPLQAKQKQGTEITKKMTQAEKDYYVMTIAGTYGMKAMQTLLAEGSEGWEQMTADTLDAATAADVQAAKMKTWSGVMEAMSGSLETVQIKLGTAIQKGFTPLIGAVSRLIDRFGAVDFDAFVDKFITPLVDGLIRLIDWVSSLDDEMLSWIAVLAGVAAAVGPVLIILGSMVSVLGTVIGAAGLLISPLGLVALAVGALGVAFATNFGGIRDAIEPAWEAIKEFGATVGDVMGPVLDAFGALASGDFTGFAEQLAAIDWGQIAGDMTAAIGTLWDTLTTVGGDVAGRLWDAVMGLFASIDWNAVGETISTAAGALWGSIVQIGGEVLSTITGALAELFNKIDWAKLGGTISSAVGEMWTAAVAIGAGLFDIVWNGLTELFDKIDWAKLGDTISTAAGALWGSIVQIGGEVLGTITGALAELFNKIDWVKLGGTISSAIGEMWTTTLSIGAGLFDIVWKGLTGLFDKIDWAKLGYTMGAAVGTMWNSVFAIDTSAAGTITTRLTKFLQGIDWGGIGDKIKSAVSKMWTNALAGASDVTGIDFTGMFGKVEEAAQQLADFFAPTIDGLVEGFHGFLDALEPLMPMLERFGEIFMSVVLPALQTVGAFLAGTLLVAVHAIFDFIGGALPGFGEAIAGTIQVIMGILETLWGVVYGTINVLTALFTGGDWQTAAQDAMGAVVEGITNVWAGLQGILTGIVGGLVDGIIAIFRNLYTALVGGSIIPDLVNGVIGWFAKMRDFLFNLMDGVKQTLANAWRKIQGVFRDALDKIWTVVNTKLTAIKGFFTTTWDLVKTITLEKYTEIVNWIRDKLEEARTWVFDKLTAIQETFITIWDAVVTTVLAALNDIIRWITEKLTEAKNFVQTKLDEMRAAFDTAWAGMVTAVRTKLGEIKTAITSKVTEIVDAFGQIWTNIRTGIDDAWQEITSALETAISGLPAALSGALEDVTEVGSAIVDGITAGITGGWASLRSVVEGLVGDLIDWVKSLFGIESPSKVMIDLFGQVTAGMAKGLADTGSLYRTAQQIRSGLEEKLLENWNSIPLSFAPQMEQMQLAYAGGDAAHSRYTPPATRGSAPVINHAPADNRVSFSVEANYAAVQDEASLIDDLEMMQMLYRMRR